MRSFFTLLTCFGFSASGWCADDTDRKKDQWFQVDFNNTFTITSVGMAGLAGNENSYVKTFVLKYSYDGIIWHNYTNKGEEVVRILWPLYSTRH